MIPSAFNASVKQLRLKYQSSRLFVDCTTVLTEVAEIYRGYLQSKSGQNCLVEFETTQNRKIGIIFKKYRKYF